MKKLISILIALAVLVCLAACSNGGVNTPTDAPQGATEEPQKATDKPADNKTDEPAVTDVVTEAPTKEPEPTPTKAPEVGADIDAVMVDLTGEENYIVHGGEAAMDEGGIWLSIISGAGGGDNVVFSFDDGLGFDASEYPYIAFKYRLGYGEGVKGANHLYSITGAGGPSPSNGMYYHLDYIGDRDWHTAIIELATAFPAAGTEWIQLRTPTADNPGGELAYAWIGAFKSAEDVEKYDAAFNEKYGDKLVKAEKPQVEKKQSVPDVSDAFDDVLIDFEDMDEGANVTSMDFMTYVGGLNNSTYVERDGGIAAEMQFDALSYYEMVKSGVAYTASFDVMNCSGGLFGGFIFNWGDEGNTSRNFFEDSGLQTPPGLMCSGASGCGFSFAGGNKVIVYVPVWDEDAIKLSLVSVTIEAPVDFDAGYNTFRIEDNGTSKVEVFLNDALFVTIEYSGEGFNDAPTMMEYYYNNIRITGSDGTELLKTEKALFSIYKSIAFAGRAHRVRFDNIKISNK
ncbi:MAG: hypothetical protein J5950_07340 [Clostridia bacterium]|nr:hypothetical protein [Clostridia bacterium]